LTTTSFALALTTWPETVFGVAVSAPALVEAPEGCPAAELPAGDWPDVADCEPGCCALAVVSLG
jgi:hypothetical protein